MTEPVHVLVVEDDAAQAELLQRRLRRYDYHTSLAPTLAAARQMLDANDFAAVVADYRLPDGDGLALLDAVNARRPGLPVMMMSAIDEIRVAVSAMKRGAADFIAKDVNGTHFELIPATLTRLLEMRKLEQARSRAEAEAARARGLTDAIIAQAPFSIVATDANGLIQAMNPAASQLTLYSERELVNRATPLILHDPAELERYAGELAAAGAPAGLRGIEILKAWAERGAEEQRDCSYIRKDGVRIPIQLTITAMRGPHDEITGFLGVAYDISERRRADERMHRLAHHDPLTDLPNRLLLQDRLDVAVARSRRYGDKVGLMLIDLDHFKHINDTLGHDAGDAVLIEVAQRLSAAVRKTDTVARLGGDEFVVLLADVADMAIVRQLARKIVEAVAPPITVDHVDLQTSASVGVAVCPDHGSDAKALLKNADIAMYVAKSSGRGNYQVFTQSMARRTEEQIAIERDLRLAVERGELRLHYQPQVNLVSGRVTGVEALLRWQRPTVGLVSPVDFIGVAEQSGLIVRLGEWVLNQACHDIRALQRELGDDFSVAVNFSARQIESGDSFEAISKALAASQLAPACLEIEITESLLMQDLDQTCVVLQRLRALGSRIAVDDFGTGYSSLSYVTRLPIDTLKIDQSFIRSVHESQSSAAVVNAILAMAQGMRLKVTAEGVETRRQLDYLLERNGDLAQGYFFARPVPKEELAATVRAIEHWFQQERGTAQVERVVPAGAKH